MITLADRKSRFVLGKRIARKTAAEVEEGMIALLITLPPELRRSVTQALFKKFCKRDFCDEVRDFKIPEPEAVAS